MLASLQPPWGLAELKAAGFDGASELRRLGFKAAELKAAAFQARELLDAGYSVHELTAAGVRGKQLRELGVPLGDTLDAAWLQGAQQEALKKMRLHSPKTKPLSF